MQQGLCLCICVYLYTYVIALNDFHSFVIIVYSAVDQQ